MPNDFDTLVNDNNSTNQNETIVNPDGAAQNANRFEEVIQETYTADEIRDVNNITVTIPDTATPIVVFFGSQASGKTLALLRMIRYLEENNHHVVPEAIFRPQTDKHYAKMCAGLKDMAYSTYAPGGTDIISFMLVKILDKVGNPVCQVLEAPGEHYFDGRADLQFPTYINAIRTAPNRKVWVFFVEQDWGSNQGIRNLYAQKICAMQSLLSPNDRVVFLFNKVDKHRHQFKANGTPNKNVFFTNIKQQYPGIFSRYQNSGITKVLFGEYNFKTVCFTSGVFNPTVDGREVWTPEKDFYCAELWDAIR